MAMLRAKQIRGMDPKEMNSKLSELRLELMKESGSAKMGKPLKNTGKIRELRKSIARALTVKKETGMKKSEGKKE